MTTSINPNRSQPSLTISQRASKSAKTFAEPWVEMGRVTGSGIVMFGRIMLSPEVLGLAASSFVLSRMLNQPMRATVPAQVVAWSAGTCVSLITAVFYHIISQRKTNVAALTLQPKDSLVGTVTGANFKNEVLQSKMPVVVDAYATWCPPCKAVAPIFAGLSSEMKGKVKFVKFNVDEERSLAKDLGIEAMPTFLFYKNGECLGKHAGAMDKDGFRAKFGNYFV